MQFSKIVADIETEITRLQLARALLSGKAEPALKQMRKFSANTLFIETPPKPAKKHNLTPEGRRRIAEAVRRRWALQKKSASH